MRFAASLCVWLAAAVPATAQPSMCEASVTAKTGEVIAVVERGKSVPKQITWDIERRAGVGEESDHFSRPALMVSFTPAAADGSLVPEGASVSVTRYSDGAVGRAPRLSDVEVRATPDSGAPVTWVASDPDDGEAALAKRLKASWPAGLTIDLVVDGKVAASSEYDLTTLPEVRLHVHMAVQDAIGKCGG